MLEIINGSVDLGEISEAARKRVARAQNYGAATFCVPVAVEIRGGTYIPIEGGTHLWDIAGEFRFSLFIAKGGGVVAEKIVRYNVTGDGRMRRLIASESGYLNGGEVNELEPMKLHFEEDQEEKLLEPRINWREDVATRGVDARVIQVVNPHSGQKEAILTFVAVPEPGQWGGVEGFGNKFPGADRPRMLVNTIDNPAPFLRGVGVIF